MRPFSHHSNLQSLIQHFTPNWFAVNMGTGITSICLEQLPHQNIFLHSLAMGLWWFNIVLFLLFFGTWLTSIVLYPKLHVQLLKHSSLPFFLGCLPMGLTTIVNGFVLFGLPQWGMIAVNIATGLWYFNTCLSVLVVCIIPYFMFIHHKHQLETMTAIWLLPFVACEVSASSAGIIAQHLDYHMALPLIIIGYMLWGISVPLAFIIIGILFQRMVFHKLPATELGATIWLPLGPIGMGALGLMTLGLASEQLSIVFVLILCGFATWIFIMAVSITLYYFRQGLRYNMTFWSFTFPLGVYTLAMLQLGRILGLSVFTGYGTLLTFSLLGVWLFVACRTLPGLMRGNLIKNPLL